MQHALFVPHFCIACVALSVIFKATRLYYITIKKLLVNDEEVKHGL